MRQIYATIVVNPPGKCPHCGNDTPASAHIDTLAGTFGQCDDAANEAERVYPGALVYIVSWDTWSGLIDAYRKTAVKLPPFYEMPIGGGARDRIARDMMNYYLDTDPEAADTALAVEHDASPADAPHV